MKFNFYKNDETFNFIDLWGFGNDNEDRKEVANVGGSDDKGYIDEGWEESIVKFYNAHEHGNGSGNEKCNGYGYGTVDNAGGWHHQGGS